MGIEQFFKNKDVRALKIHLMDTRLADVWELAEEAMLSFTQSQMAVLLGLLIYAKDPYYDDVLEFLNYIDKRDMYNKFLRLRELFELEDFMSDIFTDVTVTGKRRRYQGSPVEHRFEAESMEGSVVVGEISETSGDFQQEVTTFMDNQDIKILDMSEKADSTRNRVDLQDVNSLANFLSRPRSIGRWQWTPGGNFDSSANFVKLDPWSAYLTASITAKMNNFRNFRCTGLKLQFRINGSPFHYGRLYVSYTPGYQALPPFVLMGNPQNVTLPVTNYSGLNSTTLPLRTHWSQYPGVFIDPSTNDVAELVLPFFSPTNYVSVVANSMINQLGFLTIWVLNPLRHSNGATDPITLTLTSWCVDPILTVPTSLNAYTGESKVGSGLPPSGDTKARSKKGKNQVNDEYGKGIVSAPASALAAFAGTLAKVPVIGPYATATRMALGTFSDVAKLFGFSKPVLLKESTFVNQRPWGPLAVTSGDDTVLKLTLDPKQEITVDPVVTGLQGVDEMSFAHIFKRESLLLQQIWSTTQAPQTNLFNIAISPNVCPRHISGASFVFFHTALSWATIPFTYWRGTLNYRIQIVASQMHRGRLAIVYNPVRNNVSTLPDQSTTYQHFVDLTEGRDYTFAVRYAHPNPWLVVNQSTDNTPMVLVGAPNFDAEFCTTTNGFLSVYVLNDLTAPVNTSVAEINVFVSAGDDFQVAAPGGFLFDRHSPFGEPLRAAYTAESLNGVISRNADYTVPVENVSRQTNAVLVLNGDDDTVPDVDNENLVFFGEQNVSLRALLKRYCVYRMLGLSAETVGATTVSISIEHPHITQWPGYSGPQGGMDTYNWSDGNIDNNGPFNYFRNTLLSYYRAGYAAYRGNIRYKYIISGRCFNAGQAGYFNVRRNPINQSDTFDVQTHFDPFGAVGDTGPVKQLKMYNNNTLRDSFTGTEMEYTALKNGIEFEHPFYAPQRFMFTSLAPPSAGVTPSPNSIRSYQLAATRRSSHMVSFVASATELAQPNGANIIVMAAAGEDFSLHYFCAAPVTCLTVPEEIPP